MGGDNELKIFLVALPVFTLHQTAAYAATTRAPSQCLTKSEPTFKEVSDSIKKMEACLY